MNLANKRASDSERRLEELLQVESDLRNQLTDVELNLRVKLDKKIIRYNELKERKGDLEKVATDLHDELQNTLLVTRRLERDNTALKGELQSYLNRDANFTLLKEKLQIEYEKVSQRDAAIESLGQKGRAAREELAASTGVCRQLEDRLMQTQEAHAALEARHSRLSARCDLLIKDNAALEGGVSQLKQRMAYYNETIATMKGSIRAYIKVRPLFEEELDLYRTSESDLSSYIQFPDFNIINYNGSSFEFDRVFSPGSSEADLYEEVEPYVWSAMSGYRVGLFAYGQTNAGASDDVGEYTYMNVDTLYLSGINNLMSFVNVPLQAKATPCKV